MPGVALGLRALSSNPVQPPTSDLCTSQNLAYRSEPTSPSGSGRIGSFASFVPHLARIQEMGRRYLFICLYLWLEKHLSRGDYKKEAA